MVNFRYSLRRNLRIWELPFFTLSAEVGISIMRLLKLNKLFKIKKTRQLHLMNAALKKALFADGNRNFLKN